MPEFKEYEQAISHIAEALRLMGHDTASNPSTKDTPLRIAKFWASVAPKSEVDFNFTAFDAKDMDELVVVKDIEYSSLCEHHFLPFFGRVHVAYLPESKIIGLSKIPRVVDFCAKKPQTQEYLTMEIGKMLQQELKPRFVAVQVTGVHTCVGCRGARKLGCETVTSFYTPKGHDHETTKQEFLRLIQPSQF